MHENREPSGTSRSNQDRERPEKAISRTAGRNVPEESDRAVVPVNLSNKEGQTSAEAGDLQDRQVARLHSVQHAAPDTSGRLSCLLCDRTTGGSKAQLQGARTGGAGASFNVPGAENRTAANNGFISGLLTKRL